MRFAVLFVLVLGACKADAERCEQATRNYANLTYWKKANAEIAQAPADRRDALRKKKLAQFTNEVEIRIDDVVRQCQTANNDEQIDCMIKAKTAEEINECADLAGKD
jgi:hypothetical protein